MSMLPTFSPVIELETQRLRLRQWRDVDREAFAGLCTDPRVMEFFLPIPDRAASDAFVERQRNTIATQGWGFWAVELRESRKFIGVVGLLSQPDRFPFSPCVEIGWRLASDCWGQGYATEAARAALKFGFERLDLPEIVAFTAVPNRRSRAVMERLGMVAATPPTFSHPAVPVGHPLREHFLYRLPRSIWLAALQKCNSGTSENR